MNRLVVLLFIGIITFAILFLVQRVDVLEDIWLWVIGFAGSIVGAGKKIMEYFKTKNNQAGSSENDKNNAGQTNAVSGNAPPQYLPQSQTNQQEEDFDGTILTVMRFSDDGDTTVGLLYVNDEYFCFTLEDAHQDVKIPGLTRIPAGRYEVDFRQEETELTKKYRSSYPDWFTFHLQLYDVPGFSSVYIHAGGDHTDTEGCLLVSDSITVTDPKTFFTNSRNTFKQFYKVIGRELNQGKKVVLNIKDESWFNN